MQKIDSETYREAVKIWVATGSIRGKSRKLKTKPERVEYENTTIAIFIFLTNRFI